MVLKSPGKSWKVWSWKVWTIVVWTSLEILFTTRLDVVGHLATRNQSIGVRYYLPWAKPRI